MEQNKRSIGQMARTHHISQQTLRLYDRMGLLVPRYTDPKNRYRYYGVEQMAVLDFIQYGAALGMTLSQVQKLLEEERPELLREQLKTQLHQTRERLTELRLTEGAVLRALADLETCGGAEHGEEPFLEARPERTVLVYTSGAELMNSSYAVYEDQLHLFKSYLLDLGVPMALFHGFGRIVRVKQLRRAQPQSTEFALPLEDITLPTNLTERLPAGVCLSRYCRRFEESARCVRELAKAAEQKRLQITGDCFCQVLSDFPLKPEEDRHYCCKLQLPVR